MCPPSMCLLTAYEIRSNEIVYILKETLVLEIAKKMTTIYIIIRTTTALKDPD